MMYPIWTHSVFSVVLRGSDPEGFVVGIEHDRPGKQGGWPAGMKQGRDLVGRKGGRGRTLLSSNPSLVKLDILGLLGGKVEAEHGFGQ